MGVKGLASVVLKRVPSAVTALSSLSELNGRSVAIDASLLTQKIHFVTHKEGQDDPQRHVKAWYTFLTALQRENIKPYVVFDGQTRLPAKMNEVDRRRAALMLQRERARAEGVRGERLASLRSTFADLQGDQRAAVLSEARAQALKVSQVGKSPAKDHDESVAGGWARQTMSKLWKLFSPRGTDADAASVETTSVAAPVETTAETTRMPTDDAASRAPMDEKLSKAVDEVLRLREELLTDQDNPVYSKRQRLVTVKETEFFSSIFDEAAEERIPKSDDLSELVTASDEIWTSLRRRTNPIPSHAYRNIVRLVDAMGVPYLQPSPDSPHEAEGICSTLYFLGLVDYVISEDTDVIVYGAPLLRRITTRRQPNWHAGSSTVIVDDEDKAASELGDALLGTIKPGSMNVVDSAKLVQSLGLTKEQFVDLSLLCGTDFTERIPKLGPQTALRLIAQHGSIEGILDNEPRFQPKDRDEYMAKIRVARDIFTTLPPIPDNARLEPREPSSDLPEMLSRWNIAQSSSPRSK